jgi:pilus assembly protein TadC
VPTDLPLPLPLLLVAASLCTWSPAPAVVADRMRRLPGAGGRRHRSLPAVPSGVRRWLTAGTAGLAVALLIGGAWAVPLGLLAAVAVDRVLRRRAGARGVAPSSDLPVTCDLLAVCLDAGMPAAGALAAVAEVVPDPLATALSRVAGLSRLGAEPAGAWSDVPSDLLGVGRAFVRAGESGSSIGPALRALAADARAEARGRVDAAVQRTGVWMLLPLGACFLPAFVCLGVVPLVLGIAGGVLG